MGKKILLADDSITIQKVIELTFSDEDFEVVTVGNGRLAVERVQEVRPDVVLCDIIMPEKDGYEVCDFVKKTAGLSHIPVLLLTGAFEPFDKERADRVKADGYLAKPFEPQALISKVKELLAQAARPAAAPVPASRPAVMPTPPAAAPAAPAPAPSASVPARSTSPGLAAQTVAFVPPPAPAAPERRTPLPSALPASMPPPSPPPSAQPVVEEAAFIPDDDVSAPAAKATPEAAGGSVETEGFDYVDDSFEPIPEEAVAGSTSGGAGGASTLAFQAAADQSTSEVPLEARAQAGKESAHAPRAASAFSQVFDLAEETEPPTPAAPAPAAPPARAEAKPPAPAPQAAAPAPPAAAPEPEVEPEFEEASFAEVAAAPEAAAATKPASEAAEVPVPVDMVEKIAQRVVAQISEKVVREIAWEVIPELAEALIKQEIERLKAELQKT